MATVGNKLSPKDSYKTPLEKYKLKNTPQASICTSPDLYFTTNFILCPKQVDILGFPILGFHFSVPSLLNNANNLE